MYVFIGKAWILKLYRKRDKLHILKLTLPLTQAMSMFTQEQLNFGIIKNILQGDICQVVTVYPKKIHQINIQQWEKYSYSVINRHWNNSLTINITVWFGKTQENLSLDWHQLFKPSPGNHCHSFASTDMCHFWHFRVIGWWYWTVVCVWVNIG